MAGADSSRPVQSNLVKVKVTGHLEGGVCVQDSIETFILGDGDIIAGGFATYFWTCSSFLITNT